MNQPSRPLQAEPPAPLLVRKLRMTADARRQHIIDRALHLFGTLGFRGTTTRAIAQAAGVSEAIIFRHFATKDDLYRAILQQKADEYGLDATLSDVQRHATRGEDDELVGRLVSHILDSHRRDPDFQRIMLFAALEGHDLAKAGKAYSVPLFAFLKRYILQRQRAGAFRRGDSTLMAFGLLALPMYFSIVGLVFEQKPESRSDRRLTQELGRIILDGLRAPSTKPARRRGTPVSGRRRATPSANGSRSHA